MKYHFPGWSVERRGVEYQVWAPGETEHAGHKTGRVREQWQAAWTAEGGNKGDVRRGDSLDEVLVILPPGVAGLFREAVEKWEASR